MGGGACGGDVLGAAAAAVTVEAAALAGAGAVAYAASRSNKEERQRIVNDLPRNVVQGAQTLPQAARTLSQRAVLHGQNTKEWLRVVGILDKNGNNQNSER